MEKGETFLSLKTLIIYSFKINQNMHGYIYIFDIYEKKNCISKLHHCIMKILHRKSSSVLAETTQLSCIN